jgi:hypothetical protein
VGLDVHSLESAVRRAHAERPQWRADPEARLEQRRDLARAHRRLYDEALGLVRAERER